MDIGQQTRIAMDKYDTLQKIVDQLEFCFDGADGGYKISSNVAFLKLKEMAIELQRISNAPILSAVPSGNDSENELVKRCNFDIQDLSNSQFAHGWFECYEWMKEEITKRGIAG
jgi:hypothetical protein